MADDEKEYTPDNPMGFFQSRPREPDFSNWRDVGHDVAKHFLDKYEDLGTDIEDVKKAMLDAVDDIAKSDRFRSEIREHQPDFKWVGNHYASGPDDPIKCQLHIEGQLAALVDQYSQERDEWRVTDMASSHAMMRVETGELDDVMRTVERDFDLYRFDIDRDLGAEKSKKPPSIFDRADEIQQHAERNGPDHSQERDDRDRGEP